MLSHSAGHLSSSSRNYPLDHSFCFFNDLDIGIDVDIDIDILDRAYSFSVCFQNFRFFTVLRFGNAAQANAVLSCIYSFLLFLAYLPYSFMTGPVFWSHSHSHNTVQYSTVQHNQVVPLQLIFAHGCSRWWCAGCSHHFHLSHSDTRTLFLSLSLRWCVCMCVYVWQWHLMCHTSTPLRVEHPEKGCRFCCC